MELFKIDGTLKARKALVAHHKDYRVGLAKTEFEKTMKAEHETLYPTKIDNPAYVVPLEREILNPLYVVDGLEPYKIPNPDYIEPLDEFIDNPDFITYDEWMGEEVITQAYQEATHDEQGFVLTPEIQEVKELVRHFVAPEVPESDLDAYLESKYQEIRKASYPPVEEFLDAYAKDDTVALQAYKDKCLAVKAKHKKPSNV